MRERERGAQRRIGREVEPGGEPRAPRVGVQAEHRPAGVARDEAVDRQALLVVAARRAGRQAHAAAVQLVLVAGEPVGPRVQERHAHHGSRVAVGGEPVAAIEQLLAGVAQRRADHAERRHEVSLELPGGERHRLEALDRVVVDGGVQGVEDAHARTSRACACAITRCQRPSTASRSRPWIASGSPVPSTRSSSPRSP